MPKTKKPTGKKCHVVFAPWRMEFIMGEREKGCIFCNRAKRRRDREDLILARGKTCFVILNKYPYNNGHLMVVTKRHIANLTQLKPSEMSEAMKLLAKAQKVMVKAMQPHGFNVGFNLGRPAGAGIEDHLHFHLIPRWIGDANFWPLIGETKSMPQHLMTTYDLLKSHWK